MIPASQSRRSARPQPLVGGRDVSYLHVVDSDVYGDWESVYRDNVDRLYRLMYARVGNRPDAEDLTSEVFITAFRPLRLSASRGEVQSYLLRTAKTVLAAHWRRRLGQPVTTIDPESDLGYLTEPPGSGQPSDAPARADKILNALPDRYRRILQLRFLEACSIKEAAHTMQVTVANAKVLQHRALRMAERVSVELEP
jgi:RNA polymerase sigma-70 factor (ECF subfamily)